MSKLIEKILPKTNGKHVVEMGDMAELTKVARSEREQLGRLIKTVDSKVTELTAIEATVDVLRGRVVDTQGSLSDIEARLSAAKKVDELLGQLENRTESIEKKTSETSEQIRSVTEKHGDVDKATALMKKLIDESETADTKIEHFRKEAASLSKIEQRMGSLTRQASQYEKQFSGLKQDYHGLQDLSNNLNQEAARLQQAADAMKTEIAETVKMTSSVESKVDRLAKAKDLLKNTEEQVHSLNALSEHVTQKMKTLEAMNEIVEHASTQSNKLNELVWDMDRRISQISEGDKYAKTVGDKIESLREAHDELAQNVVKTKKERKELTKEATELQNDLVASVARLQDQLAGFELAKQEVGMVDQRVTDLSSDVRSAEDKLKIFSAKEKELKKLATDVDAISGQVEVLTHNSDALHERIATMGPAEERIHELTELAERCNREIESVKTGQQVVQNTSQQIREIRTERQELRSDLERLRQDREEIGKTNRALAEFRKHSAEVETRTSTIRERMDLVDVAFQRFEKLQSLADSMETRLESLTDRSQLLETVEARLNQLGELGRSLDTKIEKQLASQGQLESMRASQEGLALQLRDLEKLADSLQRSKIVNVLEGRVTAMENRIERSQKELNDLGLSKRFLVEKEQRAEELEHEVNDSITRAEDQLKSIKAAGEKLHQAEDAREAWQNSLDAAEDRQRELTTAASTTKTELKKLEGAWDRVMSKRTEAAAVEEKLETLASTMDELHEITSEMEDRTDSVRRRHTSVERLEQELSKLHDMFDATRGDARTIVESKGQIEETKKHVDELLNTTADLETRIRAVDSKRSSIYEAEFKVDGLSNLLHDIDARMETFTSHKALIDHLSNKLSQLDYSIKQAEVATRALQEERQLAASIQERVAAAKSKPSRKRPPQTATA